MDTTKTSAASYEVMHGLEKEYLRYTIVGPFGFNLFLKIGFAWFDRDIVEKVIATILHRHESLRTTLTCSDNTISQLIHEWPTGNFAIQYIDWTEAADREQRLEQLIKALPRIPFDFEKGPLVDVRVVHLAPDNHILFFTLHHVISDEISVGILRRELITLYEIYLEGGDNPFPPLRMQYREYASWVRRYLDSGKSAAARAFYLEKLARSIAGSGASAKKRSYREQLDCELKKFLQLPDAGQLTERLLGFIVNIYTNPAASYTVCLPRRALAKLKQLAARQRSTLFSVLLALLSLLLRKTKHLRYQRIFIPFDTRVQENFLDIVGWLVGSVILCLDCNGDKSLQEWVPAVEQALLEASEYRFYPYEQLMKELDVTVDVISPIQINFIRGNGSIKDFTPMHNYATEAHFDLACTITEYDNGIRFYANYRTDKYAHAEITALFQLLEQWLEQLEPAHSH